MEMTKQYFANIHRLLEEVLETQSHTIDRAVTAVADTLERGGMVYAFGTGGTVLPGRRSCENLSHSG